MKILLLKRLAYIFATLILSFLLVSAQPDWFSPTFKAALSLIGLSISMAMSEYFSVVPAIAFAKSAEKAAKGRRTHKKLVFILLFIGLACLIYGYAQPHPTVTWIGYFLIFASPYTLLEHQGIRSFQT